MYKIVFLGLMSFLSLAGRAQDASVLLNKLKAKLSKVDRLYGFWHHENRCSIYKSASGQSDHLL